MGCINIPVPILMYCDLFMENFYCGIISTLLSSVMACILLMHICCVPLLFDYNNDCSGKHCSCVILIQHSKTYS